MQPSNRRSLQKTPLTMPGVYEVQGTLKEGNWAIKIDLKHGRIYFDHAQVDKVTF